MGEEEGGVGGAGGGKEGGGGMGLGPWRRRGGWREERVGR